MLPPKTTRELVKEIEASGKDAVGWVQRALRLVETQTSQSADLKEQRALISAQAAELAALRQTVAVLQAREDGLVARAAAEASQAAAQTVADLARRLGHLESVTAILGGMD